MTLEQAERLLADFEEDGAGEPGMAPFGKATVRHAVTVLRALIDRVRTAERERDALRPVVEAVVGASADQPIGSVRVFAVGDSVTSRGLLPAAVEALRASKEGK